MSKLKKYNILLTGGHAATTASAVIEEIKQEKLNWELFWIGSKYAIEGKKTLTLEYEMLPGFGVEFLPLTMGRLQRRFTAWTIPSLLKIPVGFVQSFYYLFKVKPQAVLSFGGFSSFPVVFSAKILGIPVIIHEQTAAAGRANLAASRFADKIALARPESIKYFPGKNVEVTGNPVSKKTFHLSKKMKLGNPPAIFITGGSRGSQSINEACLEILPSILAKYKVIHQTGDLDFNKFANVKKLMQGSLSENYTVFPKTDHDKMIKFFEEADVIISRSGANTVSDILASGRPAVVIPLSISYMDEQRKNAEFLAKIGFAKIILQKDLSGQKILFDISEIIKNYPKIISKIYRAENPDEKAAAKVVDLIKSYLK